MTATEAAKAMGVSRPTLYRMIREGRIIAKERKYMKRNRFLVLTSEVERLLTGQPPAE